MNKGVLTGIILGALSCGITILLAAVYLFSKYRHKSKEKGGKRQPSESISSCQEASLRNSKQLLNKFDMLFRSLCLKKAGVLLAKSKE